MKKIIAGFFLFVLFGLLLISFGCLSGGEGNDNLPASLKEQPIEADTMRNWSIISFVPNHAIVDGKEIYYYLPNKEKVIYYYHGTQGSAEGLIGGIDWLHFMKTAVERGYGIVVIESEDRESGKYNVTQDPKTNVDIVYIKKIDDLLKKNGLITDATKHYGLGMSRGASFVTYVGAVFNYKAVAPYNAPGLAGLFAKEEYKTPTFFNMSENDTRVPNEEYLPNYNILKNKGVPTVLMENYEQVVTKDLFMRVPGVTLEESAQVFDAFVANGYITSEGVFTDKLKGREYNPDYTDEDYQRLRVEELKELQPVLDSLSPQLAAKAKDLINPFKVALAYHEFHSGFVNETIDFFDAQN